MEVAVNFILQQHFYAQLAIKSAPTPALTIAAHLVVILIKVLFDSFQSLPARPIIGVHPPCLRRNCLPGKTDSDLKDDF
jgi:hypothetical protein